MLLKNSAAPKVLVRRRELLVTLQILISSSFSLVEETHGSLGQCVSFSLIYVGSGSLPPLFFFLVMLMGAVIASMYSFLGTPAVKLEMQGFSGLPLG